MLNFTTQQFFFFSHKLSQFHFRQQWIYVVRCNRICCELKVRTWKNEAKINLDSNPTFVYHVRIFVLRRCFFSIPMPSHDTDYSQNSSIMDFLSLGANRNSLTWVFASIHSHHWIACSSMLFCHPFQNHTKYIFECEGWRHVTYFGFKKHYSESITWGNVWGDTKNRQHLWLAFIHVDRVYMCSRDYTNDLMLR